jgi:hypothetical protein
VCVRERERVCVCVRERLVLKSGRITCSSAAPAVLACPPNLATSCFFVCASMHRARSNHP